MRLPLLALALSVPALAQPALHPRTPEPKPAAASTAPALPITRVALYKNGVGFFEHAGRVTGDQFVTIDFTSAQLNDVLQSLTAVDLNGGRISGAGYNSTTPLEQQLKTLPLALDANPTGTDFYNAVRGARVQVTAPGASFTGRLLSIDIGDASPKSDPSSADPALKHHYATIVSDIGPQIGTARTIELTSAVSVRLLDTALQADVTHYLELIASSRSQGLRHLTLLDRGTGPRDLRVSYISEVPVWKSTYRILFSDTKQTADSTATLQGWSVVDNTTGSDWLNVHLDLIAGAPQSFIQPLSIPLYARRPEIAMPGEQQFAPQTFQSGDAEAKSQSSGPSIRGTVTDTSGASIPNARVVATNTSNGTLVSANTRSDGTFNLPVAAPGQYRVETTSPGFQTTVQTVGVSEQQAVNLTTRLNVGAMNEAVTVTAAAAPMLQTESAMASSPMGGRVVRVPNKIPRKAEMLRGSAGGILGGMSLDALSDDPNALAAQLTALTATSFGANTSSSAFDDFFQYSLTDPITIRKNESALVPILQTKLPIERVTLWSRAQPVPLRALWLTNSSTLTLDRGSFSIVENGSFGGEGLLDPIHPGEKRLLSYAADQAVRVDNQTGPGQRRLRSVIIAKGILTQQFTDVVEREYNIRNAAPDPRTVVIEHTRTPGYTLQPAPTPKPDETLPNSYRFRVPVPANSTVKLTVAESRTSPTFLQIGTLNDAQIRVIVGQLGTSGSTLQQQLQPVLDAQRTLADLEAKKAALDNNLETLDTEEQRQRANIDALKSVDKASQKRFVDELGRIEDQILTLQKQQTTLDQQIEAAQQDLNNKVEAVQFTQTLEP